MGILCNQIYFPASKKFPRAKVLCQNQGEAWEVVGLPNDGISIFKKGEFDVLKEKCVSLSQDLKGL